MTESTSREQVSLEAAQWWFRIGVSSPEEASYKDREEFSGWLRQSPVHIAEFLRVARVHHALGRFREWSAIETSGAAGVPQSNVVRFEPNRVTPSRPMRVETASTMRPRRRLRAGLFAAAAVAALAAIAASLFLQLRDDRYQTERAERREVALNDGSVVRLEPETELRVHFGERTREVSLLRGRALFQVARDPGRSFEVRAGSTRVRALGTAFGVEQRTGQLIVTVAEGKVAVSPARPPARSAAGQTEPQDALLVADQQISVGSSGRATPVHHVDASRALAWAEGRLVFDSAPLADVLAEFNRYNKVELRVEDPQLAQRKVSGIFKANDPETLIAFVEAGAQVSVDRENQRVILFKARGRAEEERAEIPAP